MVSDSPESSIGYLNLGMYFHERGEMEKARDLLENAIKAFPKLPDSFATLGIVYWELENPDNAIELLNKAISMETKDYKSYATLGLIYEKKGNISLSKSYFDKAKLIEPNIENMLRERAEMICREAENLQAENKLDKSKKLFKKALLYYPKSASAFIGIGSVIAEKGMLNEAIGYFKKAVEIEPENPIPHYDLSLVYRLKGMKKESDVEMAMFNKLGGNNILK